MTRAEPTTAWTEAPQGQRVVLVTGPSGAGLSTAIAALEDAGFEAVDNIPLSLVGQLIAGAGPRERTGAGGGSDTGGGPGGGGAIPLAIGIDSRNREFEAGAVLSLLDELRARAAPAAELLFLDCDPAVLERRYAETRRRHPLAPGADARTGIARDLALVEPLRERAGALVDTSEMTVHDLREQISRLYAPGGPRLAVTVTSFSYRRGLPPGLDMVFDCRVLPNPHWVPELRARDGRDPQVAAHALGGPVAGPFLDHVLGLVGLVLPGGETGGRAHLGIGFGCTGGQHRSVAMTERLAATLAAEGWQVSKRHRELDRHAGPAPRAATAGQGA